MSTPYALPTDLSYLDAAGTQKYATTKADTEIVVLSTVDAPPAAVFDAWFKYIWFVGAEQVAPGEGRGHVNHTRLMTKQGIEEKIVAAGVPSSSDARGAVPSVMYTITNPGKMPIALYLALVRFLPAADGKKTEIVWTIKLTAAGKAKTAMLAPVVQKTIGGGLKMFAKAINARAKL